MKRSKSVLLIKGLTSLETDISHCQNVSTFVSISEHETHNMGLLVSGTFLQQPKHRVFHKKQHISNEKNGPLQYPSQQVPIQKDAEPTETNNKQCLISYTDNGIDILSHEVNRTLKFFRPNTYMRPK